MTDATITIKVPVEVTARSYPKGWRARVGPHVAESSSKPMALHAVRDRVAAAAVLPDAGKVRRVAVVGDIVYVLASRSTDGRWCCVSGKLGDEHLVDKGTADVRNVEWATGDDFNNACVEFHRFIVARRDRVVACEQARPLHDESSRLLHVLKATGVDVVLTGDETPVTLASIVALTIAGMRVDLDAANARDRVDAQVSAGQGMSPEGLALARLFNLHGDDLPARIAATARTILAGTSASKWSGTFVDLADLAGGTNPLDVLARACDALDDPEGHVMDYGIADDGPIARHYEVETTRERKVAYAEGIEAADAAWKRHVAKIRTACEALDDAIAGLDIPDDDLPAYDAVLGGPRVAVTDALAAEPDEVEGLDD